MGDWGYSCAAICSELTSSLYLHWCFGGVNVVGQVFKLTHSWAFTKNLIISNFIFGARSIQYLLAGLWRAPRSILRASARSILRSAHDHQKIKAHSSNFPRSTRMNLGSHKPQYYFRQLDRFLCRGLENLIQNGVHLDQTKRSSVQPLHKLRDHAWTHKSRDIEQHVRESLTGYRYPFVGLYSLLCVWPSQRLPIYTLGWRVTRSLLLLARFLQDLIANSRYYKVQHSLQFAIHIQSILTLSWLDTLGWIARKYARSPKPKPVLPGSRASSPRRNQLHLAETPSSCSPAIKMFTSALILLVFLCLVLLTLFILVMAIFVRWVVPPNLRLFLFLPYVNLTLMLYAKTSQLRKPWTQHGLGGKWKWLGLRGKCGGIAVKIWEGLLWERKMCVL